MHRGTAVRRSRSQGIAHANAQESGHECQSVAQISKDLIRSDEKTIREAIPRTAYWH